MFVFKYHRPALLVFFFLLKLSKFIHSSTSASDVDGDDSSVDCFICSQHIPTCGSCEEDEFCYITKRSCYRCSRAICAKLTYKLKRKQCDLRKKLKCRCSKDETCLLTVRNRVTCSKAVCIDSVGPNIKFLKDYIT